jgi:hypothetical protein
MEYPTPVTPTQLTNGVVKLQSKPTLLSMGRAASQARFATVVPLQTPQNKSLETEIELASLTAKRSIG